MKTYLEPDEVDDICYAPNSARDKAILLLLRDTGIRVSELVSVKTEGVDIENRQMFIRKSKIKKLRLCSCGHKSGQKAIFCPQCGADISRITPHDSKRSGTRRIVEFSPEAADMIRDCLKETKTSSPWLFPSPRDPSKFINVRSIRYLVERAAEAVGLGGTILDHPEFDTRHRVSPHRLRDAMAIEEFSRNSTLEGLRILAHKLGHSNPETTYAHYIKLVSSKPGVIDRTHQPSRGPRKVALM